MTTKSEIELCLSPAEFVDSDHPEVQACAETTTRGLTTVEDKLRALYLEVRDGIRYDPYVDFRSIEVWRGSSVLGAGRGYCVGKAALFAGMCRAVRIPARVAFADVRNHLATENLTRIMGTDLFVWHGYVECWTDGRWVKASPTFNLTLCQKLDVTPLDFDGRHHAVMQAFDNRDARFMEYVREHGSFFDVPAKHLQAVMRANYPNLFREGGPRGSMEEEAVLEKAGQ
jgi:transglutaminase-like putative cysteine protease